MQLELSEQEREFLEEMLKSAHAELLHELHHTDTHDYRVMLRKKVDLVEALQARFVRH